MKRFERFLKDAQNAYNMELYTVTITACNQAMQQLLVAMLEYFGIDLDSEQTQLSWVIDVLRENEIQLESEYGFWWLQDVQNQIRNEGKRVTSGTAKEAIRVTQKLFTEVTDLLGVRP